MTSHTLLPVADERDISRPVAANRFAALMHHAATSRLAPLAIVICTLALLGGSMLRAPVATASLLVAVSVGVLGVWLVWSRPEIGLLAISFFTAGLIPNDLITVSVSGLRLVPADVTALGLLALFIVQGLRQNTIEIPRWTISGPLLAFAAFAVFSGLYSRFYQHVQLGLAVGELRPAVYCLVCAIAVVMVARRGRLLFLLAGLFIVADLTAGAVILNQFIHTGATPGEPAHGIWQINQLGGLGGGFGTVRVVPPGHVLLFLMANIAACLLLGRIRRPVLRAGLVLQLAFLGAALILTYTRAQWVASGIALLLACVLLPASCKKTLGRFLLVAIPVLAVCVGLVGAGLLPIAGASAGEALVSRATSVFSPNETLGSASLEWRSFEARAVSRALHDHPLLGVGVGNDYRDVTLLQGEASGWLWRLDGPSRLTRWVHNSYLYVAVKMGLVAFGVFLWFCLAFLGDGLRVYRRTPDGALKLIVLAILCSFAGLLEWAFFEAHFMLPASMATVGLMVGIVIAMESRRFASFASREAAGEPRGIQQEARP